MYGIIDIGSNTIRLTVYQLGEGILESVFHEKSTAGLAGYVDADGALSQAGIQRAVESLLRFRSILTNLSIFNVSVFATASLRNITNTDAARRQLEEETGFYITVLSGEQEAMLDYIGATHFLPNPDGLMIDIGGGSTELVLAQHGEVQQAVSMPIGSLNLYSKYVSHVLPTPAERCKMEKRIDKELDKLNLPKEQFPILCGVGGTVRATGKYMNTQYHQPTGNRAIDLQSVRNTLMGFQNETKETLLPILKSAPDRIHTLLPGMTILCKVAERFHCETMMVSAYGVREGYLLSEVLQMERRDQIWQKK